MGINVRLETEYGNVLGEVLDPQNQLEGLLPSWDDKHFACLRFVDPYGNTIFNRPQMPTVLAELRAIRGNASTPEQETLLNAIEELAQAAQGEPHLYLKFIGD